MCISTQIWGFLEFDLWRRSQVNFMDGKKIKVHHILDQQIFFPVYVVSVCAKQLYFLEKNLQSMDLGNHTHLILIESIRSGPSSMK